MSEKLKTLALTLDNSQVEITVTRATAKIGVMRYLLVGQAIEANKKDEDEANRILHLTLFPDLTAATVATQGLKMPLTFEEFIELPEEFVNQWSDAVYELNPHWRPPVGEPDPLAPKKKPTSKKK